MKPISTLTLVTLLGLSTSLPLIASATDTPSTSADLPVSFDTLGMDISAEEQQAIASAIHSAREISRVAQTINGNPFRRDAHAKATGCVRARFTVDGNLDERFRHSIFADAGREYRAWIRFSNGDMLVRPDSTPDARGMAIKIMGTTGAPIAPELGATGTQDLIMTNSQAFFNRDIYDYAETATYLAKLDRTGGFISLFPPKLHWTQLVRAKETVSSRIDSPLQAQYFSMLPYRLGETEVKFSARPCPAAPRAETADRDTPDFLTTQMEQTLETGAACFEFMVQPKVPGADMPIEDGTAIWSQADSPFIPIGRVHIPPQEFTSPEQQAFCENLSMNPWHGVGEWEPLSSLNRARRLVYNAVSKFRHAQNHAQRIEPSNWCIPEADGSCPKNQGLLITKPRWPLPRCFDPLFQPIDGSEVTSECQSLYDEEASDYGADMTSSTRYSGQQ